MTKEEFIKKLDSMVDDELNIYNMQSDAFNPELLCTLSKIKAMAMELKFN